MDQVKHNFIVVYLYDSVRLTLIAQSILGRPLSSLSSQGRRSKQRYHHFNNADSFDENNGSQLQVTIALK